MIKVERITRYSDGVLESDEFMLSGNYGHLIFNSKEVGELINKLREAVGHDVPENI